jgi:hypothetical protein
MGVWLFSKVELVALDLPVLVEKHNRAFAAPGVRLTFEIGEKGLPQDQFPLSNTVLVDVAMGRIPADLVIRNGRWVSVQTAEIIPQHRYRHKEGRIAYIGPDAAYTIGEHTR